MLGDLVAARLTLSLAIEALRLFQEIVDRLDIVGDDGRDLLCAFRASPEMYERLCVFGAAQEDDEDDGTAEDCHRTCPREMPPAPTAAADPAKPTPVRIIMDVPRMRGERSSPGALPPGRPIVPTRPPLTVSATT